MNDLFERLKEVNQDLLLGNETKGRNKVIQILDRYPQTEEYPTILNHYIRLTGLYPYIQEKTASWEDKFARFAFENEVGEDTPAILHREQSRLLKGLIEGQNIAVSAPTSFGKSFVIDAFISTRKPNNILIIVPTIALTDETRRRLYKRFSSEYKIITTTDVEPSKKNIYVFPQERAISYVDSIDHLDMMIVDEFYKASPSFDSERSSSLIKALMKLGKKASQKYYLAPNINSLNENPFTEGMTFIKLDFNTVFLELYSLHEKINGEEEKRSALLNVLENYEGKTLIYAGTYGEINKVRNIVIERFSTINTKLISSFSNWLDDNYGLNWNFTSSVRRGTGVHNGNLHRSLSQIQVKLFEEDEGLKNIICTSSIIEGVNTSAKNVVIWRNKNGNRNLDFFTYKNISGRGGRMFQHFIGRIFVLEKPPVDDVVQLNLEYPEELFPELDEQEIESILTEDQKNKVVAFKSEMDSMLGKGVYNRLINTNSLQTAKSKLIKSISGDIYKNSASWNGFGYLNSSNFSDKERLLYRVIQLTPGAWETKHKDFVKFIKVLEDNWNREIPDLLNDLDQYNITINEFFKLEKKVSYNLSSLLRDVNVLYKSINPQNWVDISPFISACSNAFLPKNVYQLEEYGLPRMISRKIHNNDVIDLENNDVPLHEIIQLFNKIGVEYIINNVRDLDSFDQYILRHFFDGITINAKS